MTWLTPAEAADRLRVTPATLRRWRRDDSGPAYRKDPGGTNSRVWYSVDALASWVAQRTVTPGS